jgi:hypothetical protein
MCGRSQQLSPLSSKWNVSVMFRHQGACPYRHGYEDKGRSEWKRRHPASLPVAVYWFFNLPHPLSSLIFNLMLMCDGPEISDNTRRTKPFPVAVRPLDKNTEGAESAALSPPPPAAESLHLHCRCFSCILAPINNLLLQSAPTNPLSTRDGN